MTDQDTITSLRASLASEKERAEKTELTASASMDRAIANGQRASDRWIKLKTIWDAILGDRPLCRDCADFNGLCQSDGLPCDPTEAAIATYRAAESSLAEAKRLITAMVEAKALACVRVIIAGWNGEHQPDGPYPRHSDELRAQLPVTNCGAIYALDDALQAGRRFLSQEADR